MGVLIDCGAGWRGRVEALAPRAILLTHSHPDHVDGLKDGTPCPVWATEETWERIEAYPIEDRRTVGPREPFEVRGIGFEAFPVEHSLRAPAVVYRAAAGRASIVYAPDLYAIHDRDDALEGLDLYVADGALSSPTAVRRSSRGTSGRWGWGCVGWARSAAWRPRSPTTGWRSWSDLPSGGMGPPFVLPTVAHPSSGSVPPVAGRAPDRSPGAAPCRSCSREGASRRHGARGSA